MLTISLLISCNSVVSALVCQPSGPGFVLTCIVHNHLSQIVLKESTSLYLLSTWYIPELTPSIGSPCFETFKINFHYKSSLL